MKRPDPYAPRTRKSIAARNALERPTAALDAHSLVCLEWAAHFIQAHERLAPQPGVTIRRALAVYCQHLQKLDETRGELWALERAGRGDGSARLVTEARARMEGCKGAMSFAEARYSPEQIKEQRELMAALERRLEELP